MKGTELFGSLSPDVLSADVVVFQDTESGEISIIKQRYVESDPDTGFTTVFLRGEKY